MNHFVKALLFLCLYFSALNIFAQKSVTSESQAVKLVSNIPEVKAYVAYAKHVEVVIDNLPKKDHNYRIKVGYNNGVCLVRYWTFVVYPKTGNIKFVDIEPYREISLSSWRRELRQHRVKNT